MADIEKKKRKKGTRRRSARVYVNANRPLAVPLSEIADYFPPDDDDDDTAATVKRRISQADRKRLAREGKALPDGSYPIETPEDLHNAAVLAGSGHGDVEAATRLIARRAKEMNMKDPLRAAGKSMIGNPYDHPGGRSPFDRVSPSRAVGQQAASTGDHGAVADPMNVPGPRELAFRHPDLRQGSTSVNPMATLRTREAMDGTGAWSPFNVGRVGLSRLDAAGATGATGVDAPAGNPVSRWGDHQSRGSATPPNGSHSLSSPQSNAVAMKASEARDVMKRTMRFPGSGAR